MNQRMPRLLISIVSPCFNEEENVELLRSRIDAVMQGLPQYDYELIFIDNKSQDRTVELVKGMAAQDRRIKLIVNARNFGHIRSPYHAFLQAKGDAVVMMASDLQDPPELLPELIGKWESGFKVVVGVKAESRESRLMWLLRRAYYRLLYKIADIQVIENFTGFGLYDQRVVQVMRQFDDPYPYFRGIISEIGFKRAEISYVQPQRFRGITKNNFYTLYDIAMLGITSHSKLPIRLATMGGFVLAFLSLLISLAYLVMKLVFWDRFGFGLAPVLIGVFFFSSIQLFFIGLLGEYVASIHTQVMKRPHVVEEERVNFDE
nr:glycosyltransferase family 2 protein [uncultured Holophaga sp.]